METPSHPYNLEFDEEAIKALEKLPSIIILRIKEKLLFAKQNPFHYFSRLSGCPEYKLRVGNYRVIANIDQENKIILILHIGHRKNIYKK